MRFTEEEFDRVIEDLLYAPSPTFVPLYTVAEKAVKPYLCNLVRQNGYLRGGYHEEDVFQNFVIRLTKVTVTGFLLRDGPEGEVNRNAEGFEDWMFTVARNIYRDYVRENVRHSADFGGDGEGVVRLSDGEEPEDRILEEEFHTLTADRLREAFCAVIDSDRGVYMILAWLAQSILVLLTDRRRMEVTRVMEAKLSCLTLRQMYGAILKAARRIPWLKISATQKEKIENKLRKTARDGVTYGEIPFREFFMVGKDGLPNGKKSISDWVNRLDGVALKRARQGS